MNMTGRLSVCGLVFLATCFMGHSFASAQDEDYEAAMAEMMAKAQRYTQPSDHHALLERFVGTWKTEMCLVMGDERSPAEEGEAVTEWLMEGRWIQTRSKGTFLGQELDVQTTMGYDNFKQSYVVTSVSSMDTAMNRSEGDLDPNGNVLLLYGTIDEYLTGEHDKMVKTVWRFESDDKMVMEVHDLPIGENNTQVIEMTFTRVEE